MLEQDIFEKGLQAHNSGDLQEAASLYQQILQSNPQHADALHLLGVVCFQDGQLDKAKEVIEKAIVLEPTRVAYMSNFANVIAAQGDLDQAILVLKKIEEMEPDFVDAKINMGAVWAKKENLPAAIQCYKKALELRPNDVKLTLIIGELYFRTLDYEMARDYFNKIDLEVLNSSSAYGTYGAILDSCGLYDDAAQALEKALSLDGENYVAVHNYAKFIKKHGKDISKVVSLYKNILGNSGANASLRIKKLYNLEIANLYRLIGDVPSAAKYYRNVIKLDKSESAAYHGLVLIGEDLTDGQINYLNSLINEQSQKEQLGRINFVLGAAFEKQNFPKLSFDYYIEGNHCYRREYNFEMDAFESFFKKFTEFVDEDFLASLPMVETSITPVFVVGMPRSGTTVAEQILAHHSGVKSVGELNDWNELIGFNFSIADADSVEIFNKPAEQWEKAAREMIKRLEQLDASYVVNKYPLNFITAGLIAAILPQAKFVICNRDPVETAISCFKNLFRGYLPFCYDLEELGRTYNCYADLMEHWNRLLPNRFYTFHLSDMKENSEKAITNLVEGIGLNMEDECLKFYNSSKLVNTASSVQIRQKDYDPSIDWSEIEEALQPLLKVLQR